MVTVLSIRILNACGLLVWPDCACSVHVFRGATYRGNLTSM